MKNYLLFAFAAFFLITACEKDKDPVAGTLELKVETLYDGSPLAINQMLPYDDNGEISFSRFSFFVHNFMVNNKEVLEVDYWRLLEAEEDNKAVFSQQVETDTVNTIAFNVGLPKDINAKNPADFSSNSPLSDFAEYWDGWKSYVFLKVEGKGDLDKDGSLETPIGFHIGGDSNYASLSFNVSGLEIKAGETTTLTLEFDLKRMLDADGDLFDIRETNGTHSEEKLPQAQRLLSNLLSQVKLKS